MQDRLDIIWEKRESFMKMIKEKFPEAYSEWPLDLSQKDSQICVRETSIKGIEEMFEALFHLKNWKSHRETEIPEVNTEEFLEEVVDAFNYFFSSLILCGITPEEFFKAYLAKDSIIRSRVKQGY